MRERGACAREVLMFGTAMFRWWGGSDPTDANTLYYDGWSAGLPSEFRLFPGFPLVFGLFFFFRSPVATALAASGRP